MNTKTQAKSGLVAYQRELLTKQKALAEELAAVDEAIASLSGPNGPKPTKSKRRHRHRRNAPESYDAPILDLLRANPNTVYEPIEIIRALDLPANSIRQRVEALVAQGKVTMTGETVRHLPIVKHKPTSIKPGEEVT